MKYYTLLLSLLLSVGSSFAQAVVLEDYEHSWEYKNFPPVEGVEPYIHTINCMVILPKLIEDHVDLFLPPNKNFHIPIGFVNSENVGTEVSPETKVTFGDSLNRDRVELYCFPSEDVIFPEGDLKIRPDGTTYIEPIFVLNAWGVYVKGEKLTEYEEISIPFIITQNGVSKNFTVNLKKAKDPNFQLNHEENYPIPSFRYQARD